MSVKVTNTTVEVTLPKDATGNVLVDVNGQGYYAPVKDGKASVNVIGLDAGTYPVTVNYLGDDKYSNATKSASVTVPEEEVPVVELKDPGLKLDIEDTVVSVSIDSEATGDVIVTVGDISFVQDAGELLPIDVSEYLSNGTYSVSVKYVGDDIFAEKVLVGGSVAVPDETVVEPKDPNLKANTSNTTIAVTVDKDATGNVLVDIGGQGYYAVIKDGHASVNVIGLDEGKYRAVVNYVGDDNFKASSTDVTVTVPSSGKNDTLVNPKADIKISEDAVSVELPKDTAGYVLVDVDGKGYYAPVKDGKASIDLPELEAGNHTVTVTYTGDNKYQSANATKTISIEDEIETIIAEDLTKVEKAPDRFEATFNDANGKALANTEVTFTLNGVTYTRTTDTNGKASIGINLDAGNYTILVTNTVTKESKELKINVLSRFAVHNDLTKYFRNASQYLVKILDDEGNPAKAGEVVTFNINGVFYNRTADTNGNVKININLNPGDYIITSEYKGCRVSNNIKVLPILTGKDLTKKFGQPNQFEATLVDGQGKAYANQDVIFNINGVFYTRTTDANGVAKLNINLQAGKYIITSYYKEAVTSNTVTVTA